MVREKTLKVIKKSINLKRIKFSHKAFKVTRFLARKIQFIPETSLMSRKQLSFKLNNYRKVLQ